MQQFFLVHLERERYSNNYFTYFILPKIGLKPTSALKTPFIVGTDMAQKKRRRLRTLKRLN